MSSNNILKTYRVKMETSEQIARLTEENNTTIQETLEEIMNAYNYRKEIFQFIPQLFNKLDNKFQEYEECAKGSQVKDEIKKDIYEEIKFIYDSLKRTLAGSDRSLSESISKLSGGCTTFSEVLNKCNEAIKEDDQFKILEVLQTIHERNLLCYNPNKYDVIFNAVRHNRVGILNLLLKDSGLNYDVNYSNYYEIARYGGIYEYNALSLALIYYKNINLSEILIEKFGADLNLFLKNGKVEFNLEGNKKNYSAELTVLALAVNEFANPTHKNEEDKIKNVLKYLFNKLLTKNKITDIKDISNVARYTYYGKFIKSYNFKEYLEQFSTEIQNEVIKLVK